MFWLKKMPALDAVSHWDRPMILSVDNRANAGTVCPITLRACSFLVDQAASTKQVEHAGFAARFRRPVKVARDIHQVFRIRLDMKSKFENVVPQLCR